ncbi:hypothetical protein EXIGLDRAFT_829748 [Exidia glandulosa HHB12029]|uniref:Uncharacterized protein n=1 Tax=Exidia glandulosa HHB12029 TaxID=1314781 RepID=A0A165P986_EXIGL|nr:hypothetical protein EXIGLDRAFT_829748 [Exidia glandulosa HHB12029]
MASLLTIPPELRHDIIERVLLYERLPPRDIVTERANREPAPHYTAVEAPPDVTSWVFLERSLHPPNADGLLCTNRQLAYETHAIIKRLNPEYKLDLLLVDEAQLWPTWTCLPVSAHFIDRVHVSIASIGEPASGAWLWSYRGPPKCMWAMYFLLELYLVRGFTYHHLDVDRHPGRPIVVRNIILDFKDLCDTPAGHMVTSANVRTFMATPDESLAALYPDYLTWRRRTVQGAPGPGPVDSRTTAPWFARVVRHFVRLLLTDDGSIRSAGVLHRRVGVIDIAVRGDTVDAFDVAVALSLLDIPDNLDSDDPPLFTMPGPFYRLISANHRGYLSRFLKHMEEVLRTRGKLGLPVPSKTLVQRHEWTPEAPALD